MSYKIIDILIPLLLFCFCCFKRKSGKYDSLPLVYLAMITILGYDSVFDYSMYVELFCDIRHGFSYSREDIAIGYWVLNKVFSFSKYGFVVVIAISAFLYYYSSYKVLKKFNCVLLGTFILFLYNCLLMHNNIIRQNLAIAIGNFLFCYLYGKNIESKGKVATIVALSLLLAYSFHYTVILGIILFLAIHFCAKIKYNFGVVPILVFCILGFVIYFYGLFDQIVETLNFLGYYGDKTQDIIDNLYQDSNHGVSSGKFLATFLILFVFSFYKSEKYEYIVKFATIVLLLRVLTAQIQLVQRIFMYYEIIEIVGICVVLQHLKYNRVIQLHHIAIVLYFCVMTYLEANFVNSTYSNYTYKTIFSSKCKSGLLYKRRKVRVSKDLRDVPDMSELYKAF